MKFKLISRICQNNKCISNYRFSLMINRKLFFFNETSSIESYFDKEIVDKIQIIVWKEKKIIISEIIYVNIFKQLSYFKKVYLNPYTFDFYIQFQIQDEKIEMIEQGLSQMQQFDDSILSFNQPITENSNCSSEEIKNLKVMAFEIIMNYLQNEKKFFTKFQFLQNKNKNLSEKYKKYSEKLTKTNNELQKINESFLRFDMKEFIQKEIKLKENLIKKTNIKIKNSESTLVNYLKNI